MGRVGLGRVGSGSVDIKGRPTKLCLWFAKIHMDGSAPTALPLLCELLDVIATTFHKQYP